MRSVLSMIALLLLSGLGAQDIEYLRARASELSAPSMHGRGYVQKGLSKAADLIADEFQNLGLKELSKNYTQEFRHDVNTFPAAMSIRVGGKTLVPGVDFLIEGNSPSIKGEYRAVLVKAQDLPESRNLDKQIGLCPDCVLVIDLSDVESKEEKAKAIQKRESYRTTHPVIWASDDKLTWSVGTIQFPNPLIEMGSGLVKHGDMVSFDICAKEKKGFKSENVIAMVEGSLYPDSFVVFTAHYDHLGMMGKEATFYGANDNASGTAYILSLAKHYAAEPADYSTVFIAFAGEEAGLVGSKYFVEHPLIDLERIRLLINLDLMGSGIDGITVVNAPAIPEEFETLKSINEEEAYLPKIKARKQTANSDHYYFAEAGVPAVFIYALGGSKAYHDIHDVNANLTFDEYEDIFNLLTKLVEKL